MSQHPFEPTKKKREFIAAYTTISLGLLQRCNFKRHLSRYPRVLAVCPTASGLLFMRRHKVEFAGYPIFHGMPNVNSAQCGIGINVIGVH